MSKCWKRYEYYTKDGIKVTPWFPYNGEKFTWQLKGKLMNFYKEE